MFVVLSTYEVMARVYSVHLMNVAEHQTAANPQTKPDNFSL